MNANGQLIETLSRSDTVRSYERAYTEVTGMPMTLRPVDAWRLPFHGKRRENAFCAVMSQKSRTCAACLQLQEKLTRDALNGPATRTCTYGLCETAVPVKLGRQTIGFLQTGQVLRQKPTAASFRRAVVQAGKLGVDIDNQRTRRAYFGTPVASRRKLDSVTDLLASFADQLAMKSNQLMVQAASAEPPIITRARQIIRERFREDISLGQVAGEVNTSRFYFCKQFRKVTGLSFTGFVARTRIEKAKNLLLNLNLRISEIAFAVGFQSLTQFNRVFKQIQRQSPTEYRRTLPAGGGGRPAGLARTDAHLLVRTDSRRNGSGQKPRLRRTAPPVGRTHERRAASLQRIKSLPVPQPFRVDANGLPLNINPLKEGVLPAVSIAVATWKPG